jgi:hypothetical protein
MFDLQILLFIDCWLLPLKLASCPLQFKIENVCDRLRMVRSELDFGEFIAFDYGCSLLQASIIVIVWHNSVDERL